MLKKENRIRKRADFLEVKDKGQLLHFPYFALSYLKSEPAKNRFGFVISKRISKKAVDRNRIKRYLSESIKRHWPLNDGGWRIVVLVKKEILKKSNIEVDNAVIMVLEKFKFNV